MIDARYKPRKKYWQTPAYHYGKMALQLGAIALAIWVLLSIPIHS